MTETTLALSVEHIAAALESVDLDDRNRITLHDPCWPWTTCVGSDRTAS